MQEERAAGSERDELTAPDAGQHPMPPLYGTRESAAGLPYAPAGPGAPYVPGAGPPPGEAIARPGQRLGARLLDILCAGVAILVTQIVLLLVILTSDPRLRRLLMSYADDMSSQQQAELQQAIVPWAWLSTLLLMLVWFLYEVPLTAVRGQTLGKLAMGVKVTGNGRDGRVGWGSATSRWAILALPSLIGVFGLPFQAINCGWLLRDKETRRCLHDKAASTYVVQATRRPTG